MFMADINLLIEKWKKRLLDFSKRNRLINYRETKRSNLRITAPELDELYKRLVLNEEELEFPYLVQIEFDDLGNAEDYVMNNGYLKTNRNSEDQQKTLRNLRSKARTAMEEQGVNILYISFGFLKWNESDGSDQTLISPLLLVPVTLTLESITSPFVLSLHEDEIVVNPTLLFKLENDLGIIFPDFNDFENDITGYLNCISEAVSNKRWEVLHEVWLSLLSFLKINMYKDLDNNKVRIAAHPVIRSLSGDSSGIKVLPKEYDNFDHDEKEKPIDIYQVIDADSSQQDAILYSKKGVSFVLQGPPGTGKSQTITNIIAECLAEGKKVLFVSEKMAALEVVHKRISQVGLDDFCLTLHSHRANKKDVLNELGRSLKLNKFTVQNEALYQLELLKRERDKLNLYCHQLHTTCLPLGRSIYEINGRLAKLYEAPDVIFELANVGEVTQEQFNQNVYLIGELTKTIGRMTEDYADNPWRSCHVPIVSHELRHDIETNLRRLVPNLMALAESIDKITNEFGLEKKVNSNSIEDLIEILDVASRSPKVPVDWIYRADIKELSQQAAKYSRLKKEYYDLSIELSHKYTQGFFNIPAADIQMKFQLLMSKAVSIVNSSTYKSEAEIANSLNDLTNYLQSTVKELSIIIEVGEKTTGLIGGKPVKNTDDISELTSLLECMLSNPKPTIEWFDPDRFMAVEQLLIPAKRTYEQLQLETSNILSVFDKEIFELDYSSMIKRYKTDYQTIFKIFNKNYRMDRKTIKSLSNDPIMKFDDSKIIQTLHVLESIAEKKSWISENSDLLFAFLGNYYLKENTNWTELDKAIATFKKINSYFGSNGISKETRDILLISDTKLKELKPLYELLKSFGEANISNSLHNSFALSTRVETVDCKVLLDMLQSNLSILNDLSNEYKKMRQFCKDDLTYKDTVDNLLKLVRFQQIYKYVEWEYITLKASYQFMFKGIDTDWDSVLNSLTWTEEFQKQISKHNFASLFIEQICSNDLSINFAAKSKEVIKPGLNNIKAEFVWYVSLFDDKDELLNTELFALLSRVEKCLGNLSALEEWIDFRNCRDKCKEAGLSDFIKKIEATKIKSNLILPVFLKRFYRLWLDAVMPKYPAVYSFRRRTHEETINEFRNLDKTQLSIARSRVKQLLVSKLPDINTFTSSRDEVGILKRELNKQRKIMPLRKLFKAIPNLLLTLKPCLMMSPLSVSLFLEAENYNFDIVIFDEASQVCVEDAIGAIMRGAQAVIVGDSKQLPPTSFFMASISDYDYDTDDYNEDDYYDDTNAFDSILDELVTVLPERTLRWHYRSRYEDLIAFSNTKIYNHSLITFPSTITREPDKGVEYIYVPNGVYDRSGKRNNAVEANKVAEVVFEHIRKYPKRSLGVVTFSEAQQQAIEAAIRQLRWQNQQYEEFFTEDKEEAFFVKNLENVQGDERDTIIFSIGYAKDLNGKMYMNFGPLSRNGGYRRLNVAITRAKHNVKLVGSIGPSDINLDTTTSEGVRMLRSYIDYAQNGVSVLKQEITESETVNTESVFEENVYDFLVKRGYRVATQVGCSGYRIDLAIKHPTLSGKYVLGIECDGATYHSARTARERDRLRQTVLEDIGWHIYRIWSTDWVKDPVTEGQKLVEAVEKAIIGYMDNDVRNSNKGDCEVENIMKQIEVPTDKPKVDQSNPYNFAYYEEANVYTVSRSSDYVTYITNVIRYVIQKEFPIHLELLCKRVSGLRGNYKTSKKVRGYVLFVITRYLQNEVELRDNFCWLKGDQKVLVKIPKPNSTVRKINYICTEEIAEAMYTIACNSYGITMNDLFIVTARQLGYNRNGDNITEAMQKAYEYLFSNGKVLNSSGKITV
jgi:very-short-patch-repair endonuclease